MIYYKQVPLLVNHILLLFLVSIVSITLSCSGTLTPLAALVGQSWPGYIRRAVKQTPHAMAAEGSPRNSHEISWRFIGLCVKLQEFIGDIWRYRPSRCHFEWV